MMGRRRRRGAAVALVVAALVAGGALVAARASGPASETDRDEPPSWKFRLPQGDAARGRDVFEKLECYKCHDVSGESFPRASDGESLGPDLAEEAAEHSVEFLAEAIVNPGALVDEERYRAPDGSSRMPSFNESLTVQELIDLVAYLKTLAPSGPAHAGGAGR